MILSGVVTVGIGATVATVVAQLDASTTPRASAPTTTEVAPEPAPADPAPPALDPNATRLETLAALASAVRFVDIEAEAMVQATSAAVADGTVDDTEAQLIAIEIEDLDQIAASTLDLVDWYATEFAAHTEASDNDLDAVESVMAAIATVTDTSAALEIEIEGNRDAARLRTLRRDLDRPVADLVTIVDRWVSRPPSDATP